MYFLSFIVAYLNLYFMSTGRVMGYCPGNVNDTQDESGRRHYFTSISHQEPNINFRMVVDDCNAQGLLHECGNMLGLNKHEPKFEWPTSQSLKCTDRIYCIIIEISIWFRSSKCIVIMLEPILVSSFYQGQNLQSKNLGKTKKFHGFSYSISISPKWRITYWKVMMNIWKKIPPRMEDHIANSCSNCKDFQKKAWKGNCN